MDSLEQIARFAFRQANAKAPGEPIDLFEYQTVAAHINGLFTIWEGYNSIPPGFTRQVFPVREKKSVFTIGDGRDFETGAPVTDIRQVRLRSSSGGELPLRSMDPRMIVPRGEDFRYNTGEYAGYDTYSISYDKDTVRLTFSHTLEMDLLVLVDYRTELGTIPEPTEATLENVKDIEFGMPRRYIEALRWGLAKRLAEENRTETRHLARRYDKAMNRIAAKKAKRVIIRQDKAVTVSRRRLRSFTFPGNVDPTYIGGKTQDNSNVVLEHDHPNHSMASGVAEWGQNNIQEINGSHGFTYGTPFDIRFSNLIAGAYLYIDIPDGMRLSALVDSNGFDSLPGWNLLADPPPPEERNNYPPEVIPPEGKKRYSVGPVGAAAAGATLSYRATVDQE